MFVRDPDDLIRWAAEPAPSFRLAEPFPHSVTDGLFDDTTLSRALDAFPAPDALPMRRARGRLEDRTTADRAH